MGDCNIVVFGSDGMLGSDLMEMLSYEGKNLYYRGYTIDQCDITKRDDLENVLGFTGGSITHVFNAAAYTNVDGAEDNPDIAFQVNSKAVAMLSEICLREQIHLTHISTDYVFEGLKKEPYLEMDEVCPLSVYGRSKLEGEYPVKNMGNKGLIIRTAWLYGKHGKNFIDTILNKLEFGVPIKVVDDQIGSPTYTMDLANVIIQLATTYKSGLYHVTNNGFCSWFEFAQKGAEYMKLNPDLVKRIKSTELDRKAERPKFSALSLKRLNSTLPEPIRSWEKALYQYLIETKKLYEY